MRVVPAEGKTLRVSRATWPFPLPLSLAGSSGASEGPRACPQPGVPAVSVPGPQAALPHDFHSGPNRSPRFPLQVDRNSPLWHPWSQDPRDGSQRTPMCMHLHMPTCTDKDTDLTYMWETNGTDRA